MDIAFNGWISGRNIPKLRNILKSICKENSSDIDRLSDQSVYGLSREDATKLGCYFGSVEWGKIPNSVFVSNMKVEYRRDFSVNGVTTDILKSGIQKYIRRANVPKAVWCAIELDLFAYSLDKRAEGIRTNFIHRLMINYLEEISIANPKLWFRIDELIDILFVERNNRKGLNLENLKFQISRLKESKSVYKLVHKMCESKHTRSMSHYRMIYGSVHHDKKLVEFIQTYYPDTPSVFKNLIDVMHTSTPELVFLLKGKELVNIDFRKSVDNLVWCIENKKKMGIFWAFDLIKRSEKTRERRLRHTKAEYIVFEIMLELSTSGTKKYIELGMKWFAEIHTKENFMCWLMPLVIMLGIYTKSSTTEVKEDRHEWIRSYTINLSNEVIKIDDYVLDMHTLEGKRRKKDAADFGLEGSIVHNESDITDRSNKEIYTGYKIFTARGKREYEKYRDSISEEKELSVQENKIDTTVVNVKVEYIRPEFNNLREWCEGLNNVYIGRKRVVFIDGKRYPPEDSIFANPYKVGKDGTRNEIIQKYKTYILEKIERKEITQDQLDTLRGKKLGCWCKPDTCHGDVLAEILDSNPANYEDYETAADGTPFMKMDIEAVAKKVKVKINNVLNLDDLPRGQI